MTEYAIFNDEGCIERGFWTQEAAEAEAAAYRARAERDEAPGDPEAHADALCPAHEDDEQPAWGCTECAADDGEDSDEDGEED